MTQERGEPPAAGEGPLPRRQGRGWAQPPLKCPMRPWGGLSFHICKTGSTASAAKLPPASSQVSRAPQGGSPAPRPSSPAVPPQGFCWAELYGVGYPVRLQPAPRAARGLCASLPAARSSASLAQRLSPSLLPPPQAVAPGGQWLGCLSRPCPRSVYYTAGAQRTEVPTSEPRGRAALAGRWSPGLANTCSLTGAGPWGTCGPHVCWGCNGRQNQPRAHLGAVKSH